MFGDFTYLQSLDTAEKNCNISSRAKMLSSWTFLLLNSVECHSRHLLIAKTYSYRHTEYISLDSESNRYYSMKINRNSQTYGVFVY